MSSTTIIAVIATFIIASFILSAISYTKQQALKKRKLMISRLKQQADEALSYMSPLLKVDKDYDLILQLQTLVVNALSKALALNPEDKITHDSLITQKTILNKYQQSQRDDEITCWLTTDTELSSTLSQLSYIDKLLDLYRNNRDLSETTCHKLKLHLNSLRQQLSLNTYLYLADTFGEQNNITSYQLYLKRAIQAIKKSNIEDTQKIQKIKELSQRIQEVKSTGRTNEFKNLIKPSETAALNELEEISISE